MHIKKPKPKFIAISRLPAYVESITGDRPSLSTVWRWVLKKTRGRKLRSVLIGGRRYTRRVWVDDFLSDPGEPNVQNDIGEGSRRQRHWQASDTYGARVYRPRAEQLCDSGSTTSEIILCPCGAAIGVRESGPTGIGYALCLKTPHARMQARSRPCFICARHPNIVVLAN